MQKVHRTQSCVSCNRDPKRRRDLNSRQYVKHDQCAREGLWSGRGPLPKSMQLATAKIDLVKISPRVRIVHGYTYTMCGVRGVTTNRKAW